MSQLAEVDNLKVRERREALVKEVESRGALISLGARARPSTALAQHLASSSILANDCAFDAVKYCVVAPASLRRDRTPGRHRASKRSSSTTQAVQALAETVNWHVALVLHCISLLTIYTPWAPYATCATHWTVGMCGGS